MEKVEEDLTYHDLLSSEANLWSMLYLTGYLTRIREDRLPGPLPEGCFALDIPRRSDIVVQDYSGDRVAVFEIKYAGSQEGLERSCAEAVAQIDGREYGEVFQEDYSKMICYRVAFYKKRCLVKKKELL